MKILFVTSCYPSEEQPHYCIFLEQQVQALQELGEATEVLLLTDGTENRRLPDRHRNGVRICEIILSINRLEAIFLSCGSRKVLGEFPWAEYDVVSMHFGAVSVFYQIAAICRKKAVSSVMTFHGLNIWGNYFPPRNIIHSIYEKCLLYRRKRTLNITSAAVCVSDSTCNALRKKACSIQAYTVYNGVDQSQFYPARNKPVADEFHILCVGNLIPIKGQAYLIEAVAQVLAENRKVKLTLIGSGSERSSLENECAKLGISQAVSFLGAQPYPVVAEYMRICDIFILPSFFEALGCVFLEAMSSGALTCGCKDTGADEIIRDGHSGLLLEQKSAAAIADAIRYAMDNPDEAKRIAEGGIARAAVFSWEQSARSLRDVYIKICSLDRGHI